MSPIQQMLLGVGAVATKTYVDDVFSTFLYEGKGDNTTNSVTNNVDLTEGGMVWTKGRDITYGHIIYDSLRGQNYLTPNENYAQATDSRSNIAFNSTGYTFGDASSTSWGPLNEGNKNFASWSFRKAPGFFDVVTYSGNSNNRTISHSLGSVPGCIIIKCTSASKDWQVGHRGTKDTDPWNWTLKLNSNSAAAEENGGWNDTAPTSSVFSLGTNHTCNLNGETYVAYVFAGGESTAATARSISFGGSSDWLNTNPASGENYQLPGDFTIECWVKPINDDNEGVFAQSTIASYSNWGAFLRMTSGTFRLYTEAGGSTADRITGPKVKKGEWQHVALVRSGSTVTMYVDGINGGSYTDSNTWGLAGAASWFTIGAENNDGVTNHFEGLISNFRVTKGQALYTSAFKVPTTPLTTTSQGATASNVLFLHCNNASTTGGTVIDTVVAGGSPAASTDSPFDDPAGFVFGENGDQGVIKCGSYVGNASTTGPEINLGFEPQYVLVKNASSNDSWRIFDSMRGIVTGGDDALIHPNSNGAEYSGNTNEMDLTSTGFKIVINDSGVNGNGYTYIYLAIRRSDGYCGKLPELGTDVFNMVMGTSNSDVPTFVSGFVTDFAFNRQPTATENWWTQSRLTGDKYLVANNTDDESTSSPNEWDFMNGWYSSTSDFSSQQSWMWKRHAGFDVVTYKGDGVAGRPIPHSLSKTPEMIILKSRTSADQWVVGHKGLNGGTNPWHYWLKLQSNDAESNSINNWNDQAPTSTHFIIDDDNRVNKDGDNFIVMLFASVDGISKVGYYTGNGTAGHAITVGFQPRFLIIKSTTQALGWHVFDTARGWGSGNDEKLELDSSAAQGSYDYGAPTSTGFTIAITGNSLNGNGEKYIYYAHA